MTRSVLDRWLTQRMRWAAVQKPPNPEQIGRWQIERLREIVAHAMERSPFYAELYKGFLPSDIKTAQDFSRLPRITPDNLRESPERLLCVSQDDIARVVTLQSSGTTGHPKRVFHTPADLEATTDFFDWGMRLMVDPGQTALVLLPGSRPGGVGKLLSDALARSGVHTVIHGVLEDVPRAVNQILESDTRCIVGPAAHVNMLAREWTRKALPEDQVNSVLLCWDTVPDAVVHNVRQAFGCTVFRHWGMVETGLGGAVECKHGMGMHLRETDVFVEITNPATGELLPDGEFGEMVVSAPLRRGMPLLRYRTGDHGRILPGRCPCGSPLRRLDPHIRRLEQVHPVDLTDLNEILYALPGLWDFSASFKDDTLHILACGESPDLSFKIKAALESESILNGTCKLAVDIKCTASPAVPGIEKRRLHTASEA